MITDCPEGIGIRVGLGSENGLLVVGNQRRREVPPEDAELSAHPNPTAGLACMCVAPTLAVEAKQVGPHVFGVGPSDRAALA